MKIVLTTASLLVLASCVPTARPEAQPQAVRTRPQLSAQSLTAVNRPGVSLIDGRQGNCPVDEIEIPGEGYRIKGTVGGLAIAPNPPGVTPVSPFAVGPQISAQAAPGTEQAAIIVVDDFNGNAGQPGVYFIDQQEGSTLAGLQSGATEAEVEALETNRQYSHGALVFNHTLALLNAADQGAAGNAANRLAAVPSLRRFEIEVFTPTERSPLVVPVVVFPRLGVTVAALDTQGFATEVIAPRLQATIRTLADQQDISRFAVNLSFGLVPCSVLADFGASRRPDPTFKLTFEAYLQAVLGANRLDANRFRDDLVNILTTPVGTDPLLTGADAEPGRSGAAEISYLAAAGNYGLPYALFPGYWSEFVAVSAQDAAATPPAKSDYSNTGEVLMPGGYYTLTAYNPESESFIDYPNIRLAGTSFAAPALSVFTALDFTGATPRCSPTPVSPLAFFKTDPPVAVPLPDLDLPLADALSRYCP